MRWRRRWVDDHRLAVAKKLVSDQRASKVALERLVVEDGAPATGEQTAV